MLRSPLFDIADVLRHRVCGAIGNVCHNSRGDLDVIRCALGDQAGLVPRPSVKILEVEAENLQSVAIRWSTALPVISATSRESGSRECGIQRDHPEPSNARGASLLSRRSPPAFDKACT